MSDTPRTDAAAGFVLDSTTEHPQGFDLSFDGTYVPVDFARELERENAKLRAAGTALRDYLESTPVQGFDVPDSIYKPFLDALKPDEVKISRNRRPVLIAPAQPTSTGSA